MGTRCSPPSGNRTSSQTFGRERRRIEYEITPVMTLLTVSPSTINQSPAVPEVLGGGKVGVAVGESVSVGVGVERVGVGVKVGVSVGVGVGVMIINLPEPMTVNVVLPPGTSTPLTYTFHFPGLG